MKRRWFQFRLRTLLGILTLVAVSTGLVVRHVQFVQQRIRYHEERLANCEERMRLREDPDWLLDRFRITNTDIDPNLPEGHLLYNAPTSERSKRKALWAIMREIDRETALLGKSKTYHQDQIEHYQESLWQPWIRVLETSEEILDLPPEILPELPDSPTDRQLESELETLLKQRADPESNGWKPRPEVRSPWQSIERPLPRNFDRRDVQAEKAAA